MKCYCDIKGALHNVFEKTKAGIMPCFTTDHDLVKPAQQLLAILPITVLHAWVKGHYTGTKLEFKHSINYQADKLVTQYQLNQQHCFKTMRKLLPPPNYKSCLLFDNMVITSKVYQMLAQAMHGKPTKEYIRCKANWSQYVFTLFNWNAHEQAL